MTTAAAASRPPASGVWMGSRARPCCGTFELLRATTTSLPLAGYGLSLVSYEDVAQRLPGWHRGLVLVGILPMFVGVRADLRSVPATLLYPP